MNQNKDESAERPEEPIVIRDKRRVHDQDGMPRTPATAEDDATDNAPQPDGPADVPTPEQLGEIDRLTKELAERTGDLQRVSAEYANYRKRTDREREELLALGQSSLLTKLLPVLDDIDRADQHGDLTGGFKNVADALRKALTDAGLEEFGVAGDEFDPQIHQAVSQLPSADVQSEVLGDVVRKGYRQGERVLREAMVAVKVPE